MYLVISSRNCKTSRPEKRPADHWPSEIITLTEIGEVTARIFGFNDLDRVIERKGLIEIGRFG